MRPTRTPVLVAAATVAALAVTACGTPAQPSADSARPAATSAVPSAVPSAAPSPPAPTPATSPSPTPFTGVLEVGSTSDAVVQLQQRLTELGYWIGTVDGKFGTLTEQALWALQRTAGLAPSGTTTTATWNALTAGTRPKARSTSGHVIEVDLKHELVLFVTNGHVDTILHTSTGGGYSYVSEGVRSLAITPKGHFATYRVIDANHKAPLGWMYRPRYFTGGVAIHGDASVPNRPVSHGCVRVTNAAMDWIWSNNLDPIGTSVWVY